MSVTTSYQVKLWKLTGGSRRWCRRRTLLCKFYVTTRRSTVLYRYCTVLSLNWPCSSLASVLPRATFSVKHQNLLLTS